MFPHNMAKNFRVIFNFFPNPIRSHVYTNIVHELSLKNAWLPPIFFWISIILGKSYLSYIIINQGKNTFELVGTVLNELLILVKEVNSVQGKFYMAS